MAKAKKKAAAKKPAAKPGKAKSTAPLKDVLIAQVIHIEVSNGKKKELIMDLLKVEKYKKKNRVFEIHTQRADKKKKLIIDAFEIKSGDKYFVRELRTEMKIDDLNLKPKQYQGYDTAIALIKEAIDNYIAAPDPSGLH